MNVLKNWENFIYYQPIVSLKDGKTIGYEVLCRDSSGFTVDQTVNLVDATKIQELKSEFKIFLHISTDRMNHGEFRKGFAKEILQQSNLKAENVVFKLAGNKPVLDMSGLKKTVEYFRQQGYKVALSDIGSGYSSLNLIASIHPDFIKLDMDLIRNIHKDGLKRALIQCFIDFCSLTDIKMIAEGIETESEMNTLIDLGMDFGQGCFIEKASEQIREVNSETIKSIYIKNFKKNNLYYKKPSMMIVGEICHENIDVTPSCKGSRIIDLFNKDPSVLGIPVVDKGKVVGMVMKDKFYAKLGTQYGFALYINRSISILMDRMPLTVDYEMTIETVSKLAMTRKAEKLYDYVIVTQNGQYYGIVTIKDLLEKTVELEVNYAKHLNPLSGLPGNILIEQKLEELIVQALSYTVLYIDIDNFKAYNDAYGFENGDKILQFTSQVITQAVGKTCYYDHFVGHIGGDDFIIGAESHDIKKLCEAIIYDFEKGVTRFYSKEDLERKYIYSKNRHGKEEKYGLLTLSIAGVSNAKKNYRDIYELAEKASKLKKACKEFWESHYIIE